MTMLTADEGVALERGVSMTLCLRADIDDDLSVSGPRNEPGLYEIPEGPYFPPKDLDLSQF